MSSITFVAVAALVGGMCFVVMYMWLQNTRSQNTQFKRQISSMTSQSKQVTCANMAALAIPIVYDTNGLPMIDLTVGTPGQVVRLCLDTGSPDMLIKTPEKYDPALSTSSVASDESSCTRVVFGTQSDSVCPITERVLLSGRCVKSSAELKTEEIAKHLPIGSAEYDKIVLLGSSKRERSEFSPANIPQSDYDVFGLANSTDVAQPALISQLNAMRSSEGDLSDGTFTFVFGEESGKNVVAHLIIGRLLEVETMYHRIAQIPDMDFYRVVLSAMYVGDQRVTSCPNDAIIDSGSNYVFAKLETVQEITKLASTNRGDMRIILDGFELIVPHAVYSSGGTYYIEETSSPSPTIVIGTMFLRNVVAEFNAITRTVKMAHL
jgi:hypothetical protein